MTDLSFTPAGDSDIEARRVVRNDLVSKVLGKTLESMEAKVLSPRGLRIVKRRPKVITKLIFKSSYHAVEELPASVRDLFRATQNSNPAWTLRYLSDANALRFLTQYCSSQVVQAFRLLKAGSLKADLLRYCLLYVHGGVWSDLTQQFHVPLDALASRHKDIVLVKDRVYRGMPGTYQAFIASIPRHPILLRCIDFIVLASQCKYMGINCLDITGPSMMRTFADAYEYAYSLFINPKNLRSICDLRTEKALITTRSPDHRAMFSNRPYYARLWEKGEVWNDEPAYPVAPRASDLKKQQQRIPHTHKKTNP